MNNFIFDLESMIWKHIFYRHPYIRR